MQYSRWDNRDGTTFRISFNDNAVGHHMSGLYHNRGTARNRLDACRLQANNARERAGIARTDSPD